MTLNPILMFLLAVLSLVVGTVTLDQTDDWRSGIPFAVFISLFCLSLFAPEVKISELLAWCRAAYKNSLQAIKVSAEWLGAFVHYGARYLAQKRFETGRARHAKSIVDG